jgi:hypothetical protein
MNTKLTRPSTLAAALLAFAVISAQADGIPAPRDVPYPAPVRLEVDATGLDHRMFRVRRRSRSRCGPLVLLYQWLPGNHSTTRPVELLAGLTITAGRMVRTEWRRDRWNAFHVDVPGNVRTRTEFSIPHADPDQQAGAS